MAQRQSQIEAEQSRLLSLADGLEREKAALEEGQATSKKTLLGGTKVSKREPSREELGASARIATQSTQISHARIALSKELQEIQFELHLRDTPDLIAKFGPGVD